MVTMEMKSAISWVLVPNISIPNFVHLYTSITELWAIMLLHHFGSACRAALELFVFREILIEITPKANKVTCSVS